MRVDRAATAPPATADSSTRSQWLTRDTAARLAIRNHLPLAECAHFGQHRTAQVLYDAVVARYSSPATAALGRLLLPYLFPELSAFAIVEDMVSNLRASDARYRAAVPAEFLDRNPPPMYITLYFIVTRLPDSLRSVRDHFLSLDPTSLTVDLLEQHLLAAETSAVAVGAACGTQRQPFFEGCSPSPLAPSYASAAAADVSVPEDVGAASASAKRRSSKGKGGRGGGGGSGGGGDGSGSGGGGSSEGGGGGGTVGGSGGSGGGGGGSGGSGSSGGGGSGGVWTGARRVGSGGGQHLLKSRIAIFDLDFDAILSAMYALSVSAEGECYQCVSPDPGIAATALGASESGTLPGTAPAQALHTFTLDSGTSRYFFRGCTTLTPLSAPVLVRLADPSEGPVMARSSTVLSCPAVPSGSLSGPHLPSFSTNLVSTAALQDAMVTTTTPGGQRVSICTCTWTRRHLATFTHQPGSSLYTLATEPSQVAASAQVSASGQVAASCSCRLLSLQTLIWHHRVGHPSLPRLCGMHSRLLVSGLPRSLPPLPPSPAPPCLPCVEGRQRAAPHSSSFPPTTAPLQTLHIDVKGQVVDVLIPWIHTVCLQLRERFGQDLPVLRLHFDRGGEFSSSLLREFCRGEGILQLFTLPDSPQQNGIVERRIGLVIKVTRTSMIHAAPPHFLWPFAGPAPSGVSQVDPLPGLAPVQVAVDSGVSRGAASGGGASGGAMSGGAEPGGEEPGGADSEGTATGGAEPGEGAEFGGSAGASPRVSPQQLSGGAGVAAGAGVPGGTTTTGPGGARPRGTGAARAGGVEGAGAVDPTEDGATDAGGSGAGGAGVGGTGAGGAGVGGAGAGGAGVVVPGDDTASPLPASSLYTELSGGLTERREPASRPVSPVRTARRIPRLRPPPVPARTLWHSVLPLPTVARLLATAVTDPSFESNAASALVAMLLDFAAACRLDYASAHVAESASACPPSVGGECALGTDVLEDRQEDFECLAAAVPRFASMLLAPEGDLDTPDIPTPHSYVEAITGPYSSQWQAAMDVEMASWKSTGTYVDEVPPPGVNIVDGMWIFRVKRPPGSPPAFKVRYVARGFTQRQGVDYFQTFFPTLKMTTLWVLLHVAAQRDYELNSLDFSTAVLQGSLHEEMWLRRPPGFTGSFPASTQWSLRRPVYGLRQVPREWHDTLRTTLTALGLAPSTADPSLFLRTDTSLPLFYVLVYVDELVFATAYTKALTLVKSELQKRLICTDLGELRSYLGLQITWDRARRIITLTQSHMVHQVLKSFGFQFSSPQPTPLSTSHSLSAPPSDKSVEPSGPYPELVGCLMYLMRCIRPDLAYPPSLLARYVAPGRHRKLHWDAAKRVLRYLCSTSGMGLVLGGRGPVVLTGHTDASWSCSYCTTATVPAATAAIMATPSVLTFDTEGRPIKFEVWLDDLHLFLQITAKDDVSLYDHTSSTALAPPATADSTTRSQWQTRDAHARLAVRSHLPLDEREHFGQHKTAKELYDAVLTCYSSPATATIGRLSLPYLFPDLSAFATVADLITHLRTRDLRYRAALPPDFLAKNPPPMYLTLYHLVTCLPDSLRSFRDQFLALSPTDLTVDLLEKELLAAEKSIVAVVLTSTLGFCSLVVLTGHSDASWVDDQATQRSSQGYTFSLGSGSVSWRSTRSSSVLSSSCEAEIYATAMAAQELRWLTYLLTDLGERPSSPPVLYVDNKVAIALCQEHRLEHRTKHIALRYFLARELQQRGQLCLRYVATRANTADIFTKALQPGDHQRFCTVLGLVPAVPHLL
ncbi:unnamed protein product [Closterium sp. NIES-54]